MMMQTEWRVQAGSKAMIRWLKVSPCAKYISSVAIKMHSLLSKN
jgi:hypothetical protein